MHDNEINTYAKIVNKRKMFQFFFQMNIMIENICFLCEFNANFLCTLTRGNQSIQVEIGLES